MTDRTGMDCPECEKKSRVTDVSRYPGVIERKRVCTVCGHEFETTESIVMDGEKEKISLFIPKKKH